jgi:hypothetical protein
VEEEGEGGRPAPPPHRQAPAPPPFGDFSLIPVRLHQIQRRRRERKKGGVGVAGGRQFVEETETA